MINPLLYWLLFLKAAVLSTGGLGNLPNLHHDLIEVGWAKESDFGQSIAIGQLSPGPNGLWVISLGYLTYGYPGALLALLALVVPPFLVLIVSALYKLIERQRWVKGLMRGISLAVVGVLLTVSWTIIRQPGIDWRGWLIGAAACGLAATRKVHLFVILGLAAGVGYVLYR